MGLDFDKVMKRKEEEEKRSQKTVGDGPRVKNLYWKPKLGKNRIRFMPPWTEVKDESIHAGQIWREIFIHYGTEDNKYSFACPVRSAEKTMETDPICSHVKGLYATKNPEDGELAKELRAKQRLFSSVVDLDDPVYTEKDVSDWAQNRQTPFPFMVGETKVQLYSYGYTVFNQLLDILTDGVDISDLNKGFDVFIARTGKGKQDTKYNLRLNPGGPTPFKFMGSLKEQNPNLDLLMPFQDLDRMQSALSGSVGSSLHLANGEDNVGEERTSRPQLPLSNKKPTSVDIDSLYSELKQSVADSD